MQSPRCWSSNCKVSCSALCLVDVNLEMSIDGTLRGGEIELACRERSWSPLFASESDKADKLTIWTSSENRRFLEVIIKGRRRFEALRDFTVDGAMAELDRLAMERKDAGDYAGARTPSPRGGSLEYSRGNSISSRGLGDVPEDGAFALADDEDDVVEDGDADGDDGEIPKLAHVNP